VGKFIVYRQNNFRIPSYNGPSGIVIIIIIIIIITAIECPLGGSSSYVVH